MQLTRIHSCFGWLTIAQTVLHYTCSCVVGASCAMSDSKTIVQELQNTRDLLASRASYGDDDALKASYANSMAKQLSNLASLSSTEGKLIIDELKVSPYGEETTRRLLAIIDDKLQSSNKCNAHGARKRKHAGSNTCQFLHKCWHFFTQQDWDFFRDPKKSFDQKMSKACFRFNRLGLCHPDEQALRWLLALLLIAHYEALPSNKEIFKKLNELKLAFASERTTYSLEEIHIYPDTPSELTKEAYAHAYDTNDPPIIVDLHGVRSVADRVALRSNSALLHEKEEKKAATTAGSSGWRSLKAETAGSSDCISIAANGTRINSLRNMKSEESPDKFDASPGEMPRNDMPNSNNPDECKLYTSYINSRAHDDLPKTEAEQLLYANYKSELWKLRARSASMLLSSPGARVKVEPEIVPRSLPQLGLTATLEDDGSLMIEPRALCRSFMQDGSRRIPIKATEAKAEAAEAEPPTERVPTFKDLDPHSQAAINALNGRNLKKNKDPEQKHAIAKEFKGKKGAAQKAQKELMKRPAAKKEVMKRPAATKEVKREPLDVDKTQIKKAMPKDDATSQPVLYNGGIVYTVHKAQKFRALRVRGDAYTESSACWGKTRTKSEAWSTVIRAIDKHARSKKA
jgi:hypothetical protein